MTFFKNQYLNPETQLRLGRMFGQPIIYLFVKGLQDFREIATILRKKTDINIFGGVLLGDTTSLQLPSKETMLYAVEALEYGGDTEFVNQCMALNHLSDGMQKFLRKQKIINISGKGKVVVSGSDVIRYSSAQKAIDEFWVIHSVVRTHPETKEKALCVNGAYSLQFSILTLEESIPLLEFLFRHQFKSEFTCRFKWEKGSVAIWNNRCTLYIPIIDYHSKRSLMHRITFFGGNTSLICPHANKRFWIK